MDDSKAAFNAANKVLDLFSNGTDKERNIPEIVAFHSIEHHKFPKYMPIMVPSGFGGRYTVPAVDYRKIQEEYRRHGEEILGKTKEIFEKEKIEIETRLVDDEKPEDYIKKVVDEEHFDLVVIGNTGEHSKLGEFLLGSVTQEIVKAAPCDILVIS
ncbi:MAG: universal stress protein [Promethearchaeota archaeon]|nr:MAG: universal stress protein [Candidatus Lokiarchaeota archaeon]